VVAKIILAMPSGRLSSFSSDQGAAGSNIFADAAAEQLSVDQGQSDAAALGRRPGMGEVSALVAANLWRDSTVTGFAGDQRDYSAGYWGFRLALAAGRSAREMQPQCQTPPVCFSL